MHEWSAPARFRASMTGACRVSVTNGTPARQNCSPSVIDGNRMGRDYLYEYFL
jgi:hypothetical protein